MPARPRKKTAQKQPRKETEQRRKDAVSRPVDGGEMPWATIVDKDPDYHYVLCNIGDPNMLAKLQYGGYEPVCWEYSNGQAPVGTRPMAQPRKFAAGEEIVVHDHLLMRCTNERFRQIQQHGISGNSGWNLSSALERRMFPSGVGVHPIQGIPQGPHLRIETDKDQDGYAHGYSQLEADL